MEAIFSAWGRILTGYQPALSIEITRECPLRCPGCYAYGDDHLGGGTRIPPAGRLAAGEVGALLAHLALEPAHHGLHTLLASDLDAGAAMSYGQTGKGS